LASRRHGRIDRVCQSAAQRLRKPAGFGELLAVLDAGAYGMSLASNYNTRGRPPEVMVEGARARLIRPRETAADMMRGERK